MTTHHETVAEVAGFYRILSLITFRRTQSVSFDVAPIAALPQINSIDRVMHQGGAVSPGPVEGVARPWYMHPHQDDNLLVLHGTRHVDIYSREHGRMESFEVTPDRIETGGILLHDGPAMLVWPRNVFHRIRSGSAGSASINLAVHYPGFDIRSNFNIYDLDPASGEFRVIREGFKDQIADADRFLR